MFQGGESRSFTIFPLRVVFLPVSGQPCPLSVMVSVSKRHFKQAVNRNRVKRLIRECWRLQKQPLADQLTAQGKQLAVVIIYLSDELPEFALLKVRVLTAVQRLCEMCDKVQAVETTPEQN